MLVLFLMTLFAIATGVIAARRGRSGFGWAVLGAAFPVLPLVVLVMLPRIARPGGGVVVNVYHQQPDDPGVAYREHGNVPLDAPMPAAPGTLAARAKRPVATSGWQP